MYYQYVKKEKKICNGPFMYRCGLHQFVSGGVLERPLHLKKKTCGVIRFQYKDYLL